MARSADRAAITGLQRVLDQWSRFEQMKDQWATWLKETDMKLHAVNLKDTLQQKRDQLEELQVRRTARGMTQRQRQTCHRQWRYSVLGQLQKYPHGSTQLQATT